MKSGLTDSELLELLLANGTFAYPEKWIEYARNHAFKRVAVRQLNECPSCESKNSLNIGAFVYYSSLCRLEQCSNCELVYVNVRFSDDLINILKS